MSTFRRVVTGHAANGQSIIASDSPVSSVAVPGLGGIELGTLWSSDQPFVYPDNGSAPPPSTWFPPLGGVRFIEFVLPPDGAPQDTAVDTAQAADAAEQLVPGLLSHFDDEDPGMHRSATTDMLYVLSGRCVLELDDGSLTELKAGDVVVQSGTMHRWKNPHDEACRVIGAIVGAHINNHK